MNEKIHDRTGTELALISDIGDSSGAYQAELAISMYFDANFEGRCSYRLSSWHGKPFIVGMARFIRRVRTGVG
jgi:hypothetical protein